jgi:branched-chain amino acid transport system permease protein
VTEQILLQALNGLVVGSSLALVASGLALLFGVLHIINFAQGDYFMLGGYAVWFVLTLTQNYLVAMVVGTLLVAVFGGALLSAICWPLLQKSPVLILLATLGLSLVLQQLATNYLGGDTKMVAFPVTANVQLGPIVYPLYYVLVVITGMGVLVAGYFALRYTRYGIWLRAVAQNRPMAASLGVPVPRVYLLTLAVCSGLAGMGGGLLLPLYSVYPTVGNDVILNAFIVVVAGGLGNFRGAAIISLVVGEVLSIGSLFLQPNVLKLVLFALVIVLLVVRSRSTHGLVRL